MFDDCMVRVNGAPEEKVLLSPAKITILRLLERAHLLYWGAPDSVRTRVRTLVDSYSETVLHTDEIWKLTVDPMTTADIDTRWHETGPRSRELLFGFSLVGGSMRCYRVRDERFQVMKASFTSRTIEPCGILI